MNLLQWMRRSEPALAFDDYLQFFNFNGLAYPFSQQQTLGQKQEEIGGDFQGFIEGAYKRNGVVFACMLVRQLLFSEARFQFRQLRSGRPGDLFGTPALGPLESPWPGATTGDLLTRAIQDADLAGNFYAVRQGRTIKRLRPDWVTIMVGSHEDPDVVPGDIGAELLGYIFHPGGRGSGRKPVVLLREQVAHFAPIPDPAASFRGMSWLTPVVREIMGDQAATNHKLQFFEGGATPNLAVSLDPAVSPDNFEKWIAMFEAENRGIADAYRTLYLGGGADVKIVGSDMKEVDFKVTQGAGETRIAAAAGVPPIIVGLSEGLEAATYSNYGQARRRFADGTMRPLWRNIAGSLATIVPPPAGADLWYDDRDIPFLQEDLKDAAEIQQTNAVTTKVLIEAGFEPTSVVEAVNADDMARLKHTGLVSVQLQPPGEGNGPDPASDAGRALARLLVPHLNGN